MDDRRKTSSETIDSELIGIVYEVAFDPKFWPDLLEDIASLFKDRRSDNQQAATIPDDDFEQVQLFSNQLDRAEAKRLVILLPHLFRALKLKRNYNATDHMRGQAQAIIEQFPVGVILVNADGYIISANQFAQDTISESKIIFLKNNVLCIATEKQNQQLKHLIYEAVNTPLNEAGDKVSSIKIDEPKGNGSVSLLITPDPYPGNHYDKQADICAAIFIAPNSIKQKIATSAIQSLFSLSPAEARLAALLTTGMSLNDAAEESHISKNTAKVQLKSIFSKVGVSRQAELIKRILTSPAVFNPADKIPGSTHVTSRIKVQSHINKEGDCILKCGRRLTYAEYGDPNGLPVIHLHGVLGCRYERLPDDSLTKKLGVKLIVPDRPGYGLSESNPDQSYLTFADDLLEFVDYLGFQKISLMGLSVGAIYGSAFAYKSPQYVNNIAMVSATPPFRSFSDLAETPPSMKLLITFSKYLPTAAKKIVEIAINNACKNPEKFLDNIPVSASDQVIFSHALLKDHFKTCLLAGSQECYYGFVQDILLSAETWTFPFEDIKVNMDFWHGTDDTHSPISRIQPVIDAAQKKHFYKIEGGGHFLIYNYWKEILEKLVN